MFARFSDHRSIILRQFPLSMIIPTVTVVLVKTYRLILCLSNMTEVNKYVKVSILPS